MGFLLSTMNPDPPEQFISEPITPVPGTFDPQAIAMGEPGLPARFVWRGEEYRVDEVLTVWKTSGPEADRRGLPPPALVGAAPRPG
ncbi:MAG: DUF6504 family protein [Phycisphaerales bacterium]